MFQFFKYTLATIFGLILFSLLVVVLMVAIISSANVKEEKVTSDHKVLKITIDDVITEREPDDFFKRFQNPWMGGKS